MTKMPSQSQLTSAATRNDQFKKKKTELQYSFVFIWQYIIKKLKDVGREDIANDKRRENDEKFHTQDIK